MKFLCKFFGHKWKFPWSRGRLIESKDYVCHRCGINRAEVEGNVKLPELQKLYREIKQEKGEKNV